MIEQLSLTLLILIGTLPIILIFKENRVKLTQNIGLASLYHMVYVALIFVPIVYTSFQIPITQQNWTGKLLAILFSIMFYFATRKHFKEYDYVLSLPKKKSLYRILVVGLITLFMMSTLTIVFSKSKDLNLEVLCYQMTMPGLDEELWRGILLGLLMTITGSRRFKFGHPAVWATTLIFALGHSLFLQDWEFAFTLDAFIITGILGYILGWMTYYSKSILPAIIFHNLMNFSTNALEMLIL